VLKDAHLTTIGFFREQEHPTEGRIRGMSVAATFASTPADIRRHAPRLGEHTLEILREAGYDAPAIDNLLATGAAITHSNS
jgi:crotonobetainyl-CoA:carnitine CoA-transferase CaiB-like acyl-CoA transferase